MRYWKLAFATISLILSSRSRIVCQATGKLATGNNSTACSAYAAANMVTFNGQAIATVVCGKCTEVASQMKMSNGFTGFGCSTCSDGPTTGAAPGYSTIVVGNNGTSLTSPKIDLTPACKYSFLLAAGSCGLLGMVALL